MIEVRALTKRYGRTVAVDGLSFRVGPGCVTGFLGPNEAGKATTLRGLLGDPGVLLFDEPVNGLDPEGVRWIRELLRALAAEGRTVLVSSHLMGEMELGADRLVIIGRGRLLADTTVRAVGQRHGSLEDFYLALTADSVEHRSIGGWAGQ